MGQIGVTWAPGAGKVLEGSYTLSHGITPSVLTIVTAPLDVQVPQVSDISFTDGERALTFKDCLFSQRGSDRSSATWRLQFLDRRWRWRFNVLVGRYNIGLNSEKPVPGTEQTESVKSAQELAVMCLEAMEEANHDIELMPKDQYPETEWDYTKPAQALAELCDRYHLLICYDPTTGKVSLCKRGEGYSLMAGPYLLADEIGSTPLPRPSTLRAICGHTEHEHEFLLEPVGLDVDGSIKPIDELSYEPNGGWGEDFLLFSQVDDTPISDTTTPGLGLETSRRKLAEQTVFRWYRIVPEKIPGWKHQGVERENPLLDWLLPISSELVQTVQTVQMYGKQLKTITKRRPAFVRGEFADDLESMQGSNTTIHTIYPKRFDIDEQLGIVKFSEPVIAWAGNTPGRAVLYLRCVVFGERHTRDKNIGGSFGIETVDCTHLALQYRDDALMNWGGVTTALDDILAIKATEYVPTRTGSRTYAGIHNFKLDGSILQITWSAGPSGATTQASESSEHDPWVPPENVRRQTERTAVRTYEQLPLGAVVPGNDQPASAFARPRQMSAANGYAGTVPAYGLARVTAITDGMVTVNRPNADSMTNVVAVGPADIAESKNGLVSAHWPLPVKYTGSAPAAGAEMGTATDSFLLTAGKTGFQVLAVDASLGVAWVVPKTGGGGSGGSGTGFEIGDTIFKWKTATDVTVNDHFWLNLCLPGTSGAARSVGDASSGGTAWASADASAIFAYLWTHFANSELPIQDSTGATIPDPGARGVSAAADFAAHRRMPLPDPRMRHLLPQGLGPDSPSPSLYPMGANEGEDPDDRTASINLEHGHAVTGLSADSSGSYHQHEVPARDTPGSTYDGGPNDVAAGSDLRRGHYHALSSQLTKAGDGEHGHSVSGDTDTNTAAATLPHIVIGLFMLAYVPS